jgi:Na+/phosphate symporter
MAFTVAGIFATVLHLGGWIGALVLIALAGMIVWSSHHKHRARSQEKEGEEIFNLRKIEDAKGAVAVTFHQVSVLLSEIRHSLDRTLEALFKNNVYELERERRKTKSIQRWTNVISANIFKAMRLLAEAEHDHSLQYAQTVRRLQKLADGHRDTVNRAHVHTSNYHKGLLEDQIADLEIVRKELSGILEETEKHLAEGAPGDLSDLKKRDAKLRALTKKLNKGQTARIHAYTSKTRLSILFYAILGNAAMISKQTIRLLEIFNESLGHVAEDEAPFDLD